MFYFYQAHSLKKLAKAFSDKIQRENDPLQPLWLITQNREISEWLSLQSASANGIFGNAKFILPSEFVWFLYRFIDPDIPQKLPGDRNALQWLLFKLFQEQPELLVLIEITASAKTDERRIFQFCGQLADVFDRYQVYRPEMTQNWVDGKLTTNLKDEKWQAEIWKILHNYWENSEYLRHLPKRDEIYSQLISEIRKGNLSKNLPEDIYLFGLSQLSKPFLSVITALSTQTNIHFFHSSVPEYSEPFKSLAQKWSKPKQQESGLLRQLLKAEQTKVQQSKAEEEISFPEMKIHSCHNERREVEVLKDQILHFLRENPDKNPQDILVLVPEMESYSGLIETAFGNDNNEPELPVSKIRRNRYSSAAQAFQDYIALVNSPYKANDVLNFMSLQPVADQFNLSAGDISLIENWVADNGIFHGLGDEANSLYSWRRGLNQILAGFSMEPESLELYEGLIPANSVVSSEQLICAGRFSRLIYELIEFEQHAQSHKTPLEWLHFIQKTLHTFISDGFPFIIDKERLLRKIESLTEEVSLADYQEPVSWELIKPWITSVLQTKSSASGRFGNGITLSTYIPYRSVPFSYIAVLGMNEGVFPRQSIRPSYDLISTLPQAGDRILKEDDTLLFLEIIIAANEHLHISYIGKEPKSNNDKLPSILVQLLMDEVFGNSSNILVYHTLQRFSSGNFDSHSGTYSSESARLANHLARDRKQEIPMLSQDFKYDIAEDKDRFSIHEFIAFFTNPSKYFIRQILDANAYSDFTLLEDRELFKPEGLKKYFLNEELLKLLKKTEQGEKVQNYLMAKTLLPEGYAGRRYYESESSQIATLLNKVSEVTGNDELQDADVEIKLKDKEFYGSISGLCAEHFISCRTNSVKGKYLAEHYLKHLILLKAEIEVEKSFYLCVEKNEVQVFTLHSNDLSVTHLDELADWFFQIEKWNEKLMLFSESSKMYAGQLLKDGDEEEALKKARNTWKNSYKGDEISDPYIELLWRENDPLNHPAFRQNALRFWKPVLESLR